MTLDGIGIWSFDLRYAPPDQVTESARLLDELGYSAVWIPDVGHGDLFAALDLLLDATTSITVATGILNLWMHEPPEVMEWWSGLSDARRSRLLLGLGVSHETMIERYEKPLQAMRQYLDQLDDLGLPTEARCLAALGPRMVELAATRSAGAHPYLVTPDQTAQVRRGLGDGRLLAVEQGVVLESDPTEARALARSGLAGYLETPNYQRSWLRQGFTEADFTGQGSDRLVDAMVAWGDVDAIGARVQAHRDAGADHVCLQVFTTRGSGPPHDQWRALASLTG